MNLKIYLAFILLLCAVSIQAQDRIYKKHGGAIDGVVKKVNALDITYIRLHDEDMNELSIPKNKVARIVYSNGTVESFGAEKAYKDPISTGSATAYATNIISIVPLAYTTQANGTINDPGVGICYERTLDRLGHFSIVLPVLLNFTENRDFSHVFSSFNFGFNGYTGTKKYSSVSILPGFKFYPTRKNKIVRYAIGVSVYTMFGSEPASVYNYNDFSGGDHHYAMYGLMITNTISISVSQHFFVSVNIDGGTPLADNRYSAIGFIDYVADRFAQFSCQVGYRF